MKRFSIFLISTLLLTASTAFAQGAWRPFSNESPWNEKIPADAKTDPESQQLIDSLSLGGFLVNIKDWSVPVYYVDSDTARMINVINSRPGVYGIGFAEPNRVPLLPWFVASPPVGPNSDNHMCIVDTTKMVEWGMWATRKNKKGQWTTGLGAVTNLRGTGVAKPWYEQKRELDAARARASGFPLIAGLIRPDEIKAGRIDHALVFAYPRARAEFLIPPASTAQVAFMQANNRFGIPMGGRIQLDPSVNVDTLNLNRAGRIIARALQEYGAYCGDYAGATVLYADNAPSALKKWKGVLTKDDLLHVFTPEFIRAHFRVIKMGTLLPGQNLPMARYGFAGFKVPGADSVGIDWLDLTIKVFVKSPSGFASVKPAFRTIEKKAVVTVDGVRQVSGRTLVDLSKPVKYKVDVPGMGSREWDVETVRY